MQKTLLLFTLVSLTIFSTIRAYASVEDENLSVKLWSELDANPQYSAGESLRFYTLKTANGSQAALVVFDLNDRKFELRPFFCEHTNTVSEVAKKEEALAAINGGFFNLNNGESTSYVVINGKNQCDPKQNKALVQNPNLKPYLDTIFNRSEFRILVNKDGNRKACIAAHNDPAPKGWEILHSLQGGPELVPTLTDSEEAFIRKDNKGKTEDSIGSHKRAARTAIGITLDNHVLLLGIASKGQEEFSSGVTLAELSKMLCDLGCTHALNLDGGTSTTMVVAEGDYRDSASYRPYRVISNNTEKLVKSGLMITRRAKSSSSPYDMSL